MRHHDRLGFRPWLFHLSGILIQVRSVYGCGTNNFGVFNSPGRGGVPAAMGFEQKTGGVMVMRTAFIILLGMACSTLAVAQDEEKKFNCKTQNPPKKGKGVSVRYDCARLEGTFDGGEMFGPGRLTYPDGRVMEGNFLRGRLFGKGVATWPDGRNYTGNFYDGRSNGLGEYTTADGTVYEGKFKPGAKLHGWGTRRSPDGNMLVGEFRNGEPFGEMLLVKSDGSQEVVAFVFGGKAPGSAQGQKTGESGVSVTSSPVAPSTKRSQEAPSSSATKPLKDLNNTIRSLRPLW